MFDVPRLSQRLVEWFERFGPLGRETRCAILSLPCTMVTRKPGTYLVREGGDTGLCGLLVSGLAYRHKITASGGRQIMSVLMPDDMIDIQHLFLESADHNVQALGEVSVVVVPPTALRDLANSIPLIGRSIAT